MHRLEHCEYAFEVASFRTLVRKSPAESAKLPRLGKPKDWSTFRDKDFGVVVRHPKYTFLQQDVEPCCIQSDFVNPTGILTLHIWDVPKDVYPGSNFLGGTIEVAVDPTIRSEGTCRQFGLTTLKDTLSKTFGALKYAETQTGGVAAGTGYGDDHLHTFQNGFCYEFNFEFVELDGTGIDKPCLIQWLSRKNEQQLLDALLSRVSFVAPGRVAGKRRTPTNPLPDS